MSEDMNDYMSRIATALEGIESHLQDINMSLDLETEDGRSNLGILGAIHDVVSAIRDHDR